jgi:CRP/FNR family transcriptional regulator, cyclic AMP receptor protein
VPDANERSLSGIELFKGLDEADIRSLEARCRWRRYRDGERVLDSGSASRDVYFVASGAVSIVNFSLSGKEVTLATAKAGSYFGELAAIDNQPRSASVVAVQDSLIAIMPAQTFVDLLNRHAEVTFRVAKRLAEIVRLSDQRIMELSTLAATQRVFAELLRMAEPDTAVPGLWVIRPLPPVREIASRVSTTRETAARALAQLYPTGLVRRKGRSLYLMDREGLQEAINTLQAEKAAKAER